MSAMHVTNTNPNPNPTQNPTPKPTKKVKLFRQVKLGEPFYYLHRSWIKTANGWAKCERGEIQMNGTERVEIEELEGELQLPGIPVMYAWEGDYIDWYTRLVSHDFNDV